MSDKLVVAISSRALFDLSDSHKVYLAQGVEAYRQYQIEHEEEQLAPGDAFPLVQKLLSLNASLGRARVEVVLVSRNSADTGLRVFNSIQHYGLDISRAAFVGGRSPYPYLAAFGCDLFLSTHADDVRSALDAAFSRAKFKPQLAAEIDSLAMTMAAVEAGLGSTAQPWAALAGLPDAAKRFTWAEITDTQVRRVNAICSLSDDELSPAALAARVVLADCARELVMTKQWLGVKLI